jgi:nucleoside-diphosphate-sugar epimerase
MREIVRQAKPDVVFHLASHFVSDHQTYEVQRLIESNVLFGTQLVEAMTLEGQCNLVNTGTSWQHYGGKDYCPANLYAATKQAFEDILEFYVEVRELRVISLKMFDTYGPGDSRNKLVNALLAAAKTGEKLLMSPGEQSIDLVHVDDVVQAFIRSAELLRSGSCIGHQRFGVSSGAPITVRTLVSECQRVLGIAIPVRWSGRPYRRREVMKPWSPQSVLPGWRPRISLAEGLATLSLGQVDSV